MSVDLLNVFEFEFNGEFLLIERLSYKDVINVFELNKSFHSLQSGILTKQFTGRSKKPTRLPRSKAPLAEFFSACRSENGTLCPLLR